MKELMKMNDHMKIACVTLALVLFVVTLVGCSSSSDDNAYLSSQEEEQRAQFNSYIACSEVCYFTQGGALGDVSKLLNAASTGNSSEAETANSSLAAGIKALQEVNVPSDLTEQHAKLLGASSKLGEAGIDYLNATMIYDSAMVEMNQTELLKYNQYITEAGEKAKDAADTLIDVKEALH